MKFWKIILVFAQRKELILNSRNLEVGKEQCSSYCIFRSSREESLLEDLKKKKKNWVVIWPVEIDVATSF